jgi:hypothetical protein
VRGVPGFYVAEGDGRTWWTLGGAPGLLIPARDHAGAIHGLKIRREFVEGGSRYSYLSSSKHGGPTAELAVHVPLLSESTDCTTVRITEGELKSDVTTSLSGIPTISIPGVGAWRMAVPVLRQLGAKRVLVALDADHRSNPAVGIALALLVRECVRARFETVVERWDERLGKGIDDVLAGGHRTTLDFAAAAYADAIADHAFRTRDEATRMRKVVDRG